MPFDNENTLPILGKFLEQDPRFAVILILVLDLGIVLALMFAESIGPNSTAPAPWSREHYKSLLFGDGIAVPLFVFTAMSFMAKQPFKGHYWFTSMWVQAVILFAGIAAVAYLNVNSARTNDATISQLLSPSCLYHSIIFGPMVYWLAMSVLGALASIWENHSSVAVAAFQTTILLIPIIAHLGMMYWDVILPRPWTAHVEGDWLEWNWHIRPR